MHSAANQEQNNANDQKQPFADHPVVSERQLGHDGKALSATPCFANGRGSWSNLELNYMITKLDSFDLNGLEPVDYLEMLFYLCSGRSDSRRLAETTLDAYGSLARIFARPSKELRELLNLDHVMTAQLAMAKLCQRFILVPDLAQRQRITSASDFLDYIVATMRESEQEVLRAIYLDQKFGIIKDEEMARGTVNTVAIYPREIAKQAIACCASSIILAHNHLSDDPTPSQSDILSTKKAKEALNGLDIVLHDHIIVSRSQHFSMSEEGYI